MIEHSSENANGIIEQKLDLFLGKLETELEADVLTFVGPIYYGADGFIRDAIEHRRGHRRTKSPRIAVLLETAGGYIEVAQRIADTLRIHYKEVHFVVPDRAMSAGTVLVMAGDVIWMDYYSVLGPIDPQVPKQGGGGFKSALGYLIQYERLLEKGKAGNLSNAEMALFLNKFDPAELYDYEQARELSISLLEEWLVRYKFKNWKQTRTRHAPVTRKMKKDRAKWIGEKLNDSDHWHSHGRGIPMAVLRKDLKLIIEDFGKNSLLKTGSSPESVGELRAYC